MPLPVEIHSPSTGEDVDHFGVVGERQRTIQRCHSDDGQGEREHEDGNPHACLTDPKRKPSESHQHRQR